MRQSVGYFLLFAVLPFRGASQEVPRHFELLLPDFFEQSFVDTEKVIELPPFRPLRNIAILVVRAHERDINYGSVSIRINGKGMGNAFEQRGTAKGTLLVMNEFTLAMRPDRPIDPYFEYSIEVQARGRQGGSYYQNWLLRENSGQQNRFFAHTATISSGDAGIPDLIVESPKAPPRVTAFRSTFPVRVAGHYSGADTVLSVNGEPLKREGQSMLVAFERDVMVNAGAKDILIEAVNGKGSRRTTLIPVYRETPVAPALRFAGKKYAVIIGISDYGAGPRSLPRLAAASSDAQMLAENLESMAGLGQQNIRVLRDQQATRDQIRFALTEFASQAGPNDLLLFYLAAHGLHDPEHPEQLYLAAHGSQANQLGSTALAFGDLQLLLDRSIKCRNTILMFDTSHRLTEDLRIPGKNLVSTYLLTLFQEDRRAVIVSAATGQLSMTRSSDASSAIFGQSLSRGLARDADLNGDRVVTAEEVLRYVAERSTGNKRSANTSLRSSGAPAQHSPGRDIGARAEP